jgi:hypothetical protein
MMMIMDECGRTSVDQLTVWMRQRHGADLRMDDHKSIKS